ncbi:MAG: DUF4411 family protein [Planctomycetota bacterium]
MTQYLVDSSPFIEAKQRYYGFDFCPGFWEAIEAAHAESRVFSIDRVRQELVGEKDELSTWSAAAVSPAFFLDTSTQAVASEFAPLMAWVNAQPQFTSAAKAEFAMATVADGWLIAAAKLHGMTLVTHEVPRPEARKRVPIPNVCAAFGVPYANTFQMLRDLGISLVI